MSKTYDGGPAFPQQSYVMPNGHFVWPEGGMTLRDYLAARKEAKS